MSDPRESLVEEDGWDPDMLTPTHGWIHVTTDHAKRIRLAEAMLREQKDCLTELTSLHREQVAVSRAKVEAEQKHEDRVAKRMSRALTVGAPILAAFLAGVGWLLVTTHNNAVATEAIQHDVDSIELRLGPEKDEDE